MNLDFAKVCGKHSAIYEAYYKQIDPKGSGAIEAMTAAKFLKKSGLSDVVLSRVWDLSDPNGKGFLDKPGFFVALKLVSLAQAGQVINMSNIYTETANPPKVGDIPKIMPPRIQTVPVSSGGVVNGDWSVNVMDRLKYEQLFESLKPVNNMLTGNKVKSVLMDSKLPMETLGKIWDLADQDKDGNLDKHEFIVAMHLVYQTLEKRTVPDVLPPELRKSGSGQHPPPKPVAPITTAPTAGSAASMPRAPSGEGFGDGGFVANFPKDIAPPPVIPPLPVAVPPMTRIPPVGSAQPPLIPTDPLIPIGAPPSVTANADWVVTPAELKRFEVMFRDSDRDKDGLVSGLEVKNVFLQSGVPQNCLAHIWALCDTNQSGKLTLEQFGLAMWMVERKQKGLEPPQVLTANMVPPSMRGIVSGVDLQPQVEPKPTYSNPELEMISKEIEELAKERRALETEIAQKEADIRIKSGEVRSLQSELDTLSATLKQLENQRGEAQKRLDDLKAQSTEYQAVLENLNVDITQLRNQVNKIREQCQKQEETINEQEGELNAKRSELQKLKDEEAALQKEYDDNNSELQKLTQHLQNTQLQISSVRSMVTQLMETQRQMTDALLMCRAAIENQDGELCSEYQLKIEPDFYEARKTLERKIDEPKAADPFEDSSSNSAVKPTNGFTTNGFDSDPFTAGGVGSTTIRSGFDDSFNMSSGFDTGFDAFGSSNNAFGQQKDPFGGDAFGASKHNAVTHESGKDDFGSDPFAALHAPTGQGQVLSPNAQKSGPPPRPESPSPALPPKKSKVPPPRPAPPRPNQGPARPTQPTMDAFGATSNTSSGGFADFADFDNKLLNIPPPQPLSTATFATTSFSLTSTTLGSNSLFNIATDNVNTNTTTATATKTPSIMSLASPSINSITSNTLTSNLFISTHTTTITTTTTTTTNSTTTTTNNHLTQQAASAFSNITTTTKSAPATLNNNSNTFSAGHTKAAPIISGPTDFSDDPFKDYRYEDPFNIKDPFADDDPTTIGLDDVAKVFKDELSSDDEDVKNKAEKINVPVSEKMSNDPQAFNAGTAKSYTPISDNFLEKFDDFNLNPSPVSSQQSAVSVSQLATSGRSMSTTSGSTNQSQRKTPTLNAPADGAGGGGAGFFAEFPDFDAFSTKSSHSMESAFSSNPDTTHTKEKSKNNNDSFFEAFNDNFNANSNVETNSKKTNANANVFANLNDTKKNVDPFGTSSNSSRKNSSSAFDAFGAAITTESATTETNIGAVTKSSKLFDDFNDNTFEDDFLKPKNPKTTTTSTKIPIKDNNLNFNLNNNSNNNAIENFAKFDAFDSAAGDDADFMADFKTALNNAINETGGVATGTGTTTVQKLTKVQNQTTLTKTPNIEAAQTAAAASAAGSAIGEINTKLSKKFAADYSKPEDFDEDLQEALKRSMLEK